MNINDPIGDMITRIRNAHLRGKDTVDSPSSNLRINILEAVSYTHLTLPTTPYV